MSKRSPSFERTACRAALIVAAGMVAICAGCTHEPTIIEPVPIDASTAIGDGLVVPADRDWTDTGVDVAPGEAVSVVARGQIRYRESDDSHRPRPVVCTPRGTFFFRDDVADARFPLPAANGGPAPCYCLIGRIDDGPTFFVGENRSWVADRPGRLHLGVNDFNHRDNSGRFLVQIEKPAGVQPVRLEERVPAVSYSQSPQSCGGPLPGCAVMVFYIDGLRPDVVLEMAAMGHIPNINRLFVEGGARPGHTFTAFPSDTITSNGTMWTGCFSDRHGIKGQVRFSRRTLHSESYLEPLGPNRSAATLAPQGFDRVVHNVKTAGVAMTQGSRAAASYNRSRVTCVPPLFARLRCRGEDWATGALPMMSAAPPLLWTRSLVRNLPYIDAQDAFNYVDDANSHYAQWRLIDEDRPVTIVWLPETDSISHKRSRGQFGATRRTIAEADVHIGRIVNELKARNKLRKTYLFLISDHGHHGGRETHLSNFDLAGEVFHRPRETSPDGRWIGGGLGLSVRQHRFWNRHKGDKSREFIFMDADSAGAARIFLPHGWYRSRTWQGPHRPGDVLNYRIDEQRPPVNLIDALTAATAAHGNGRVEHPVDLALLKINEDSVLISTIDRGRAVVVRRRGVDGRWLYRYTPVADVAPTSDGGVVYTVDPNPQVDPLGLLPVLTTDQLAQSYTERDWLRITANTRYPDGVVAMTRHMLWQSGLRDRECEYAPDLVVTARAGWYFGSNHSPGTMHGYPLADAMTASMFVSGPNIRRGARIDDPCRLVDLTPTILEMVGMPARPDEVDGVPMRSIYESPCGPPTDSGRRFEPVLWRDVDLGAWSALCYRPLSQYEHLPKSINRPNEFLDLNNIAYNALSISEITLLRILDDVVSPLSGGRWTPGSDVEAHDRKLRRHPNRAVAKAAGVIDLQGVALGDDDPTGVGNLARYDRAVDWLQARHREFDARAARSICESHIPGTPTLNRTIDFGQAVFWETYLGGTRVLIKVLDETLINSFENTVDRVINAPHKTPAEIMVPPQGR